MILNEIFNKPISYKEVYSSDNSAAYEFTAGGINYVLEAEVFGRLPRYMYEYAKEILTPEQFEEFRNKKFMYVEFSPVDLSQEQMSKAKALQQKDIVNQYGLLGSGNALEVFNAVTQILSEVTRKLNADYLLIDADEDSRQRLYRRLFKRFGKGFHEFRDPEKRFDNIVTFVVEL